MRAVGAVFRYLLNINTVWAWMILIAFALCAIQHYRPTTSVIPDEVLTPGANRLVIRLRPDGKSAEYKDHGFTLSMFQGALLLPREAQSRSADRPLLISVERAGNGHLLKWDTTAAGRYELVVNDVPAARGSLVTLQSFTDKALEYAQSAFDIGLKLVATMVLFLGLMKVGEDAGIVQLAARVFHPVIRLLFPHVPRDHPANGAILMNFTTTLLGLGNAATPFGLKAIKELEELNPHKGVASDSEVMLLAYNTAGMALIPTTLLALRKAAGCSDPAEVIGPCLLAGATSTAVALVLARWLGRLPIFSVESALKEQVREASLAAPGPASVNAANSRAEDDA